MLDSSCYDDDHGHLDDGCVIALGRQTLGYGRQSLEHADVHHVGGVVDHQKVDAHGEFAVVCVLTDFVCCCSFLS